MIRTCPNCKVKLGGYDHFFCTNCGTLLPQTLINQDAPFLRVADFAAGTAVKNASESKIKKLISQIDTKYLLVAVFIVLMLGGGLYYLLPKLGKLIEKSTMTDKVSQTLKEKKYTKNVTQLPISWNTGDFNQNQLLEAVPFDAQIVIEMFDAKEFNQLYKFTDAAYKELGDALESSVTNNIVFFAAKSGEDYIWSLLTKPNKSKIKIPQDLSSKYGWLKFLSDEQILAVSAQSQSLNKIDEAKTRVSRNFTQTPLFSSARASVPPQAKLYIFFVSNAAREYFNNLKTWQHTSAELDMIIKSISKAGSDYLIIQ